MNAFVTSRGRRFLPLLAMCCLLAGLPLSAHAGLLTSRMSDGATLTSTDSSAPGLAARVVYESQGKNQSQVPATENSFRGALAVAALILIVPAGTAAVSSQSAPPPPPPPPPSSSSPDLPPGGGHISGGPPPGGPSTNSTPEPGSILLALTGCGAALLVWLRRRRNAPMICHT